MKTKYNAVRKTSWDSLWHAVYTTGPGQEAWDRVSEDEALRIARTLPPHLPKKPLLNRRPTVIQRESEPAKGPDWPDAAATVYEELSGAGAHPVGAPSWGQYYTDRDREKNRQ